MSTPLASSQIQISRAALNQSLAQTRQHFENIVAGFTDEDEAALVDVKEDTTSRRAKDGEQGKDSRKKGKKRLSSGDGQASGSATKAGKA